MSSMALFMLPSSALCWYHGAACRLSYWWYSAQKCCAERVLFSVASLRVCVCLSVCLPFCMTVRTKTKKKQVLRKWSSLVGICVIVNPRRHLMLVTFDLAFWHWQLFYFQYFTQKYYDPTHPIRVFRLITLYKSCSSSSSSNYAATAFVTTSLIIIIRNK